MTSTGDKDKPSVRQLIDEIIEGKIDANRRFIDGMLEKIQDENHRYYLERLAVEVTKMEMEEKAGNLSRAHHHRVMVNVYKDILIRTFPG